jgi:molecular chaperone GrpE
MSRKQKKAKAKATESNSEAAVEQETTAAAEESASDATAETVAEQGEELVGGQQAEAEEPSVEETLRAECDQMKEKWLRAVAELDNVRKRSRRELVDGRRFAQAEVLRSFLEVQDNFERALQSMNHDDDTESYKSLREGVELIFQNFRRVLKDQGVVPIEALEQDFDPSVHEAVGQFEREGVESGKVIEVVQQGFRLGDMVLRPSRVIISS